MKEKMATFKKDEPVKIVAGKFRGWQGTVYKSEKEKGQTYYEIFADKKGKTQAAQVGLGMMINIPEKHIKPVGWKYESARHALAARGIKTARELTKWGSPIYKKFNQKEEFTRIRKATPLELLSILKDKYKWRENLDEYYDQVVRGDIVHFYPIKGANFKQLKEKLIAEIKKEMSE